MKKLTIVISGPPGAGTSTISKKLAEKLNLEYFSPGKIFKEMFEGKESEAALEGWKTEKGSSKELHEKMDEIQTEKAKNGNVVICGKLAIHFLKDLADFKVWLKAPLEVRAKRVAERDEIDEKDALELLRKREEMERGGWKKIYGFDYFDLEKEADFVLDNSKLSVDETLEKIIEEMRRRGLVE